MSLPKIVVPTFELILPSTDKKLKYRPFLVKEEKILLMAKESGDKIDIYNAIKQIIQNCILEDDFDVNTITIFDMEYIFIKLRAVSVSNEIQFTVTDSDDGITYDLKLDLNEVEVIKSEQNNKIMITDEVGLIMKYLTPNISEKIYNLTTLTEINDELVKSSIDYVFDNEEVYDWKTIPEKEKIEFLENLTTNAYDKIEEFYNNSPKIEHIVTYKNSNGDTKKVIFRTLDDFFILD